MHLVSNTSTELVIRDRPGIFQTLFVLIWSSFFIGIPLMLMAASIRDVGVTRLDCTRLEPEHLTCEKHQSKFMGQVSEPPTAFSQVNAARSNYRTGRDSDGDETVDNWVSLITEQGEITLFEDTLRINGTRGSEEEMEALSEEINGYIESSVPSFSVQRDLRFSSSQVLLPIAFCSSFILIGALVLYFMLQIKTARFDRNLGKFYLNTLTLLGLQTKVLPLNDIQKVGIKVKTDGEGGCTHTLYIDSCNHNRIKLGTAPRAKRVTELQTTIQSFLNL